MPRQLRLPGYEDPKTDSCELVAACLDEEENRPWFLIVDNMDDANLALGVMPLNEPDLDNDPSMKPLMD